MAASTLPHHPISIAQTSRRIFESVFPPSASATLPTPLATPSSSFVTAAPQTPTPSHGYNTRHHPNLVSPAPVSLLPSPAAVFAKESRAWHLVTSYLSFKDAPFPDTVEEWLEGFHSEPGKEVLEAMRYLVSATDDAREGTRESLLEWYVCEVRRHFLGWVKPGIGIPADYEDAPALLEQVLSRLTTAQSIYLHQLRSYLVPSAKKRKSKKHLQVPSEEEGIDDPRIQSFVRSLNSIISYSLPDPAWGGLVYEVFLELCGIAVGLPVEGEDESDNDEDSDTVDHDATQKDEDVSFDLSQQSYATVTDVDGDIIVDDDGNRLENVTDMDGINDFGEYKRMDEEERQRKKKKAKQDKPREDARKKVLEIWSSMEKLGVGGGGRRGERVFAEVINSLVTTYIHAQFQKVWASPSMVGQELDDWVEHVLGRLVVDVLFSSKTTNAHDWAARLKKLSPRESFRASRQSLDNRKKGAMEVDAGAGAEEVDLKRRKEDLESWKRIAVGRLGRLRVGELFEIIVYWPDSLGGVEDLKSYITSPPTRLHLTTTFTAALSTRLLHPAAATSDILKAYISLIRAFTVLDPRGVLLGRVSLGIRRYLRERDDTVRVIVRGIMSDSPLPPSDEPDELVELAQELGRGIPSLMAQQGGGLEELDFDDMNWVPDPVDAGPEFRRSKGLDVVGSLISLWESKDVWTKEVQAVLAGRLLSSGDWIFEKEIRTVELLKLRFGETAMQGCDVMLKDIADSKRADAHIRTEEGLLLNDPDDDEDVLELHTKILSRLFWPTLKEDEFKLPAEIEHMQKRYEIGFEKLKSKRKLTWIHSAGTAEVELELEDRIVQVPDATTWQAAVIYEFDEDRGGAQWSIKDLAERLDMDEALVRRAITFWCSKDVLRDAGNGAFAVIENLTEYEELLEQQEGAGGAEDMQRMGSGMGGGMQGVEDEGISEEKKAMQVVVEPFIVAMLTNGGPTETAQISMFLGMLVPGFAWGSEELMEFLGVMRVAGKVEFEGGLWRIAST